MEHLNPVVYDLAIILILAGVVSVIFKLLKQPVVLGYITVGILAGSKLDILPIKSALQTIQVWADIGIIFLLFTLGLEFSFKKLFRVGSSAVVSALVIIVGMMSLGFGLAKALGWDMMNALFLGGMLCMSSTTIIYKAYKDLGILKQEYTTLVFGILVVEDLFAIVLMVLLSAFASQHTFEGVMVFEIIMKLVFFMMLWFLGGMYLVPTILRKLKKYMNSEMLLIISLSFCLFMVIFANRVGFSSALGAFVMGSIFAETIEGEAIEKVTSSVKDLFGAIFFVSVGMMVDLSILTEYWVVVCLIAFVVVCGQLFFGTMGILLSGQRLYTAVKAGFSLTQIGEFAFILATTGVQLKVISPYLYPIIVAVSVITTFFTPFMMKLADPVYGFLQRNLPDKIRARLLQYGENMAADNTESLWRIYLTGYFRQLMIYTILPVGGVFIVIRYLFPLLDQVVEGFWQDFLHIVLVVLPTAPFIWALIVKLGNKSAFIQLWDNSRFNHGKLVVLQVFRILIALAILLSILIYLFNFRLGFVLAVIFCAVLTMAFFKPMKRAMKHLERNIVYNMREKEHGHKKSLTFISPELHTAQFKVPQDSFLTGVYLYKADFRKRFGISIVSILRGDKRINIPNARDQLFPFDVVTIVGSDEEINRFGEALRDIPVEENPMKPEVTLAKFVVEEDCEFAGMTLMDSGIKTKYHSMLIGMERDNRFKEHIEHDLRFKPGDLLWIAGEPHDLFDMTAGFCGRSEIYTPKK
ncbi:MAG: cation:proton antiporter [Bacteroidales bacterium]